MKERATSIDRRRRAPIMAMASRVLNRSKRLHAGKVLLLGEHIRPARSFAKEAAPPALPPLKGDEMLKNIFFEVKKKFEMAVGILRKEKITIDPEDPAAVSHYANVMKTVREKADLYSESQRIKYTIEERTKGIPDARTYLSVLRDIRIKEGRWPNFSSYKRDLGVNPFCQSLWKDAGRGLPDNLGAEALMFEALEKVEKELKKPLLRSDKKGMALLLAEFDKINRKLGIRREDLPKYEEKLELKLSEEQLQQLKRDALEAMETQLKREEFKDEELVDVKSLDIRNFL